MSQGEFLNKSPNLSSNSKVIQGKTHEIVVTQASNSPPRSRSQSTGSAHREALLFFEKNKLFEEESTEGIKDGEEGLIRNRSIRGRSQSQPSQVLLSAKRDEDERQTVKISTVTNYNYKAGGSGELLILKNESGESCSKQSWLEERIFRAHYEHKVKCENNDSVLNSLSSLDNSGNEDLKRQISGLQKLLPQVGVGSTINTSQQSLNSSVQSVSPSNSKIIKGNNYATSPTEERINCFRLPKVKLPRIFNAKSLDDIFGSRLSGSAKKALSNPQHNQSSSSSFFSRNPNLQNLDITVDDPSISSSIGITTPGITNSSVRTYGGGYTTSGYFSDPDIDRESSTGGEELDFQETITPDPLLSLQVLESAKSGERRKSGLVKAPASFSPLKDLIGRKHFTLASSSSSSASPSNVKSTSRTRKWSESSLPSTALSSALLRLPNLSGDSSSKKQSPKKPSKSLSSGSINKVSALQPLTVSAKSSDNSSGAKSSAKIAKSESYLNRIVNSTFARFGFNGSSSGDKSEGTINSSPTKTDKKGKRISSSGKSREKENSRSSISCTSTTTISDIINVDDQQPQKRKWTAVKQKWDLKLQLDPESANNESDSENKRLLFIKSQLGNISGVVERNKPINTKERLRRSLDELELDSYTRTKPHEPGRVSFRLEPEEIITIDPSSTSNSSISTSGSKSQRKQNSKRFSLPQLGSDKPEEDQEITNIEELSCDSEEMTNKKHFHYSIPQKKTKVPNQNLLKENVISPASGTAQLVVAKLANVSFLQRPNSPHVRSSPPTPTTGGNCLSSSPIVFSSTPNQAMSQQCSNNINEARLIGGENINNASSFSPFCYQKGDVVESQTTTQIIGANKARAKKSFYDSAGISHFLPGSQGTGDSSGQHFGNYLEQRSETRDSGVDNPNLNKSGSGEDEDMGDLQSPTYVKKTAHMFNSIYSSQNGASPSPEHHNPSYLNVSKSVSGYSCISYNNNANGGSISNGKTTNNGASPYSHRFINGNSTNSSSSIRPAPRVRSEVTIKVNQNNQSSSSSSPVKSTKEVPKSPIDQIDSEIDQLDSSYVPSHGKSFIMQRIERLYGTDAHAVVGSSGVLSRKSVSPGRGTCTTTTIKFESSLTSRGGSGTERIIPIQVERDSDYDSADSGSKDRYSSNNLIQKSSIVSREYHHDIMQAEEQKASSNVNKNEKVYRGDEILEERDDNDHKENISQPQLEDEMNSLRRIKPIEACPANHKLNTITLDDKEKQFLLNSGKNSSTTNGTHLQKIVPSAETIIEESKSTPITSALTKSKIQKDGNYFLQEMRDTVKELTRLSDKASIELETLDQQSEKAGNILSAIGKSNLLIKKKFKQFEELCNANLKGKVADEPETTNEDLAGFWDMVMIQVEQVYSLFKDIEENNTMVDATTEDLKPKQSSPRRTASTSSKASKPTTSKTSAAAKARDESRRKMLAEKRRQLKEQESGTKDNDQVLIFTPDPDNN